MSSALDTSLDELIKKSKKSGSGNLRRQGGVDPALPPQAPDTVWQHDKYSDPAAPYPGPGVARASAIETGTKLYISNLDYAVSNDDIKELFSEVGDLKRFSVHYDRSGRSKGTAEVVFSRRADAAAAVARYNNVQLDGKPMKIEIVGTNIATPAAPAPQITTGLFRNPNGISKSGPARDSSVGISRRGGGGGGGGGGGRRRGRARKQPGKDRNEDISPADLDADLEKYHSEAMQIN
ncbi:unnamed protein product [Spirodela intermedia]|uniref:RRM domain-containing protein n=1 Tax=Spirodela intermedia TaxID=51605 RepID=A0A7I8JGW4_SPIIN|nr:unnamed protein product [Spirodela intermedia]CAA6669366.1 unnamed protein product [Spirodela intermedia]